MLCIRINLYIYYGLDKTKKLKSIIITILVNSQCYVQMLVQCWADVAESRPALNQPWVNVSCLQGIYPYIYISHVDV